MKKSKIKRKNIANKSKKTTINILPDGSCFAVVPMDECVSFIEDHFFGSKTKNKKK